MEELDRSVLLVLYQTVYVSMTCHKNEQSIRYSTSNRISEYLIHSSKALRYEVTDIHSEP